MGGDRRSVGSSRGAKTTATFQSHCWKARTKPWQHSDDELKALKVQSTKKLEPIETGEEQD